MYIKVSNYSINSNTSSIVLLTYSKVLVSNKVSNSSIIDYIITIIVRGVVV